jgi:hypothetical protein
MPASEEGGALCRHTFTSVIVCCKLFLSHQLRTVGGIDLIFGLPARGEYCNHPGPERGTVNEFLIKR